MRLLNAKDLALVRGGRLLFEKLDVHLDAGEALHVIGRNGSGKSSLIRLAAGLLKPTAGTMECAPAALVDDHLALDRELPLARALRFWNSDNLTAMHVMGIHHLSDVPVRLLSTGQARRAALARLIASQARLWLLDEPLNGLDANGAELLAQAIADHRSNGGAIVAASHQPLASDWRRLELGA